MEESGDIIEVPEIRISQFLMRTTAKLIAAGVAAPLLFFIGFALGKEAGVLKGEERGKLEVIERFQLVPRSDLLEGRWTATMQGVVAGVTLESVAVRGREGSAFMRIPLQENTRIEMRRSGEEAAVQIARDNLRLGMPVDVVISSDDAAGIVAERIIIQGE